MGEPPITWAAAKVVATGGSMIGELVRVDVEELIAGKRWDELREAISGLDAADIAEVLIDVPPEDEGVVFRLLPRGIAAAAFAYLPLERQQELVESLGNERVAAVLAEMTPDDRTRLLEELPAETTRRVIETLPPEQLRLARNLLGYPEGTAGRYVTPHYVSLRGDMTAAQALEHVRRTGQGKETLAILYVVDASGRLLEECRLGQLVLAAPDTKVVDIEDRPLVFIPATARGEEVVSAFEKYDRVALPVVDSDQHMLGIITVDDVLEFSQRRATEEIQRLGGSEALEAPYLDVGFWTMVRKRGGWLAVLFVGEMLTATAMGSFESEIERAAVVALFVPLIISSGGNSGSQGTSLIIRSLAVGEVKLKDWWRVAGRELRTGLALGLFLGIVGFARIAAWQGLSQVPAVGTFFQAQRAELPANAPAGSAVVPEERTLDRPLRLPVGSTVAKGTVIAPGADLPDGFIAAPEPTAYGRHWFLVGATVLLSLVGVVTWGSLSGSMLPFILRRLGFDPATSSAPFVATLVDVTGLIIYFTVAKVVLRGTLL
jgi:magnesium transporter